MSPTAEKIAIIGGGKMGEALLAGWISSQQAPAIALSSQSFVVIDPTEERRKFLYNTYDIQCESLVSQVEKADVVVLAVKPQNIDEVLVEVAKNTLLHQAIIVSIAAGISTGQIAKSLPEDARIVRAMPNTPLMVGKGATAICGAKQTNAADVNFVNELFRCLGYACTVDEAQMDAVCAVSGSGPAYVCAMIEAIVDAAQAQGLSREIAEDLFVQTVFGTAALLKETGQSPQLVREAVSSPGGTTLAALKAFKDFGLREALAAGVDAAAVRSKELGA